MEALSRASLVERLRMGVARVERATVVVAGANEGDLLLRRGETGIRDGVLVFRGEVTFEGEASSLVFCESVRVKRTVVERSVGAFRY
jgi:hypothetical protein